MNQKGFTLIEIMCVVVIIGILVVTVAPYLNQYVETVRATRCIADMNGLETQIDAYIIENNELPATLDLLPTVPDSDAWGRPYVYLVLSSDPGAARWDDFGADLNDDAYAYDLYSVGADGLTAQQIDDPGAQDDVVRGRNGAYLGLASKYFD